ncbi:MAG: GGDEF domain-containing protein [Lachnospiraceae bacterium]|nr:GGDEF domain-containing protein [Lachnospiraceae bacterium]
MEPRKAEKKTYNYRIVVCAVLVITIMVLLVLCFLLPNQIDLKSNELDYGDTWTSVSGSLIDIADMDAGEYGEHFTMHKRLPREDANARSLCFISEDVYFTIYINGQVVYDFHPDSPGILGSSYGSYAHVVGLPVVSDFMNLSVDVDVIYANRPGQFINVSLMDGEVFMLQLLRRDIVSTIVLSMIFMAAMCIFILGMMGRNLRNYRVEIVAAATYLFLASFAVLSEMPILRISLGNPAVLNFFRYFCLMLLPFPLLVYLTYVIGYHRTQWPLCVGILCLANVVICVLSTLLHSYDFVQLVNITQILFLITYVSLTIYILLGTIRKKVRSRRDYVPPYAFLVFVALSAVDAVRYIRGTQQNPNGSLYMTGFSIFAVCAIWHEVKTIALMTNKGIYAEVMEELAYKDNLTGLLNRQAFNRAMTDLAESKTNKDYTFLMVDMNFLKRVNDGMGHAEGDRYLKTLAKIIAQSFTGLNDRNYRIGGDEFFAILEGAPDTPLNRAHMEAFFKGIDRVNEEHGPFGPDETPLSAATGMALFRPQQDDPMEAMKKADQQMYARKTEMKKEVPWQSR